MARRSKEETLEKKIKNAEAKVSKCKKEYENTQAELKQLLDEREKIRTKLLIDAISRSGKSFAEVLRLIEL